MTFIQDIIDVSMDVAYKNQIRNMAFDGCTYYFTTCDNNILKTNISFEEIKCIKTSKIYECLCYDYEDHCFWAVTAKSNDKIFKLNDKFEEIGCIDLMPFNRLNEAISGISFNCCNNSLLFIIGRDAFETDKSGIVKRIYSNNNSTLNSILSICPGFLVTGIRNKQQFIYLIHNDKIVFHEYLECHDVIRNIIFCPCDTVGNKITFVILTLSESCEVKIAKKTIDDFEIELCECNYKICKECKHNKPCFETRTCADILESIALQEAALAHILNAEGEKLQKILAVSNDVDEILCVNKEISKTIINVTHLEHVLYDKLTAVLEVCGMCNINCSCHRKPSCHNKGDIHTCDIEETELEKSKLEQ